MAFLATVKHQHEDGTVTVELRGGNRLEHIGTVFGYQPIPEELALIVGLESGGYIATGAVYNHTDPGTRNSG